jgi:hypothetical protein
MTSIAACDVSYSMCMNLTSTCQSAEVGLEGTAHPKTAHGSAGRASWPLLAAGATQLGSHWPGSHRHHADSATACPASTSSSSSSSLDVH